MNGRGSQRSDWFVLVVMFVALVVGWSWVTTPLAQERPVAVRAKATDLPSHASTDQETEQQYASISGRIVFEGDVPIFEPLIRQGDQNAKDWEACACEDVPDERLVVDAETRGVKNVFVYLAKQERRNVSNVHPSLRKLPGPVQLRAKVCRYRPRAMVVRLGQQIDFVNDDEAAHNLHHMAVANQMPSYVRPRTERHSFRFHKNEVVPVRIVCDFHSWMKAYVLPLDHPYAVVTGADGRFRIDNVPVGDIKLKIWHEGSYLLRPRRMSLSKSGLHFGELKFVTDEGQNAIRLPDPSIAIPSGGSRP